VREYLLTPEEAAQLDAPGTKDAAVLVPLYRDPLTAVFTERRGDLRRHAGEISFPGGRQDHPDEDLRTTALREAEEEIGLAREQVQVVGALPPTGTIVTNYAVYPFVGMTGSKNAFRPNPLEVDQVVELALADLIDGFERKRLIRRGVPIKTDTYTVGGHLIWGATARILGTLLERLRPIL
jgi:8-oxo-dGTP pyrophosphatase MutT (NUDIX family)